MNFFREHLPGCTPLNPCKSCEVALFLKSRLTAESLETLSEMMEGINSPEKILSPSTAANTIDIRKTNLSIRARNCLIAERIFSVGELTKKHPSDLLKIPNLGRRTLNEIKEFLKASGLTLVAEC